MIPRVWSQGLGPAPPAGSALEDGSQAGDEKQTWQAKTPSFPAWQAATQPHCSISPASSNAIDAVKADLDQFAALIAESPDLLRLVRSPVLSADEQLRALSAVLQRAGIGGLAERFLKLVTTNRRLFAVRDMVKGFRALVAEHKGEATAEITVAEQLRDEHVAALRAALKAVSGKDVDLAVKIDPAILGGLVVKMGSRMVDTSLRTKLNAIRHAMKEVR